VQRCIGQWLESKVFIIRSQISGAEGLQVRRLRLDGLLLHRLRQSTQSLEVKIGFARVMVQQPLHVPQTLLQLSNPPVTIEKSQYRSEHGEAGLGGLGEGGRILTGCHRAQVRPRPMPEAPRTRIAGAVAGISGMERLRRTFPFVGGSCRI
jgi:hypothetical protein